MLEKLRIKIYNLLRWSEKYIKTDMVYLAKGGGWLMLGRIVAMLAAFGLSIAFANLLTKEVYGQYRYVISIVNFLILFTLSGMGTAVFRAASQGKDGIIKSAIKTEIRWGLLGSVAALLLAVFYYWKGDYVLAPAFFVISFFAPFLNVYNLYASVLQGKKRFDLLVRYDVLTQFGNFILILPALFITKQIWILILPVLLINSVLQKVWLWRSEKNVVFNQVDDKDAIKYGKHLSLMGVISLIGDSIDQIIIFNWLGPVQFAIYNMALAPTEQIKGGIKMIIPLAFPKIAQQTTEVLRKSLNAKVMRFLIFLATGVVIYIILAKWLFGIFFPQYSESVVYSQWFAASLLASSATLYTTALQAHGASRVLYWYNSVMAIVQIFLFFVLIYFYGLLGAVAARVIIRFFGSLLSYICWRRFCRSESNML
ncbi:MAG: oligosaccharide flippase family protein [Patescibacteria group bacterium]|jgi:O-antigen/teichoic acid export membrane protein